MQLVSGTPLPPSVCFICETHEDGPHVDTFRTHMTGVYTPLSGRKYVCEKCVTEMGKLFGLVSNATQREAQLEAEHAKAILRDVRHELTKTTERLADLVKVDFPMGVTYAEEGTAADSAVGSESYSGSEPVRTAEFIQEFAASAPASA